MLLKHQYLKFAYVDIVLMVSKMCRGNLTAGILDIGVTVVLISEIDTNCRAISAWIWYILSMSWYKKICNATNGRLYQWAKYRREFERFYSCGVLWKALIFSRCHYACFCLVSLGKHIYLNSSLIHFWWNQNAWYRKRILLLGGVGTRVWSLKECKKLCHIYTRYLTLQCSVLTPWTGWHNVGSRWGAFCCVNGVSKCEENCWLRCHVYVISKPVIQKYIHVCHPDNWNTHNHQSTESPQNTQTHTVHWNAQNSQPIETPKLPRQLIHPKRPAQGSTQTTQFTEIPWSNPLKHATHLVHWNTLLLHRPLGFYSMKQTISTIYPPPPQTVKTTTTTHAKEKHHKHWMDFIGALKPVPTPPFLSSFLCSATSKTFEWHFAGRPMVARQCVLAGIGYVHVLYCHLVALHWYAFFGFVKYSWEKRNKTSHAMLNHARIQKFCQTKSNLTLTHLFRWMEWGIKIPLKAVHHQQKKTKHHKHWMGFNGVLKPVPKNQTK